MSGDLVYRKDIDGLRAIAVIAVLLFHAFPNQVAGGYLGVDVFFVISGYLIAGNTWRQIKAGSFAIWKFYYRRIRRLFPALATVIISLLLIGSVVLIDTEYERLGRDALFGTFGFANLSLWQETGYFNDSALRNPLLHLWSLGVEEQFYFVAPFALIVLFRIEKWAVPILGMLLVVSFALQTNVLTNFPTKDLFFLPMFRAWELLIGVILACVDERNPGFIGSSELAGKILSWIGLSAILLGIAIVGHKDEFHAATVLLPTIGAAAMIAAGRHAVLNRWVLSNRLMVAIGLISYPLYLWHWPLLVLGRIMGPDAGTLAKCLLLALSFGLAYLTWRYIERPVRSSSNIPSIIASLGTAMACIAGFSILVAIENGHIGWGAQGGRIGQIYSERQYNDAGCVQHFWSGKPPSEVMTRCTPGSLARSPQVALIGDSHADHLFVGMAAYYGKKGDDVLSLSAIGCPLFKTDKAGSQCAIVHQRIFGLIDNMPSVRTIIVARHIPSFADPDGDFVKSAKEQVTALSRLGRHVIFMVDVPSHKMEAIDCVHRPLQFWRPAEPICAMPRKTYDKRVKGYRESIAEAVSGIPGVTVFDPVNEFCDADECWMKHDGEPLYRDTHHLTAIGSLYLSQFYNF